MLALALAMAAGLAGSTITSRVDNVLYDALIRWSNRAPHPGIIIVAIDDQSLQEIGAWPWPRAVHAGIIDRLKAAGASAVAYDVLFVDPAADPTQDAALADAVTRAGIVCLPVSIERPGLNGARFDLRLPVGSQGARLGHVDLAFDSDGVARRAMLFETDGLRRIPHLTDCARQVGASARPPQPPLPDARAGRHLEWGDEVLIPFSRPAEFPTVPAVSVLRGEVPDGFFAGKHVLVGATANGLRDRFATPASRHGEAMAGVEVQANLLGALLAGDALHDATKPAQIAWTCAGAILLMLALGLLAPRRALPFALGLLLLAVTISTLTLLLFRLWLPPFPLIITVMVVFPIWGWRRLEAVSSYMLTELQSFADEPELLPVATPGEVGGDAIERQISLLHLTIARVRDLRRFAADTLESLPDPTFVVSLTGEVLFANPPARALWRGGEDIRALDALSQGWRDSEGGQLVLQPYADLTEGWTREIISPGGRPYLSATVPYRDAQDRLIAWIVRLTDITDLRAAEAQRERIVQLLSHDMRSPQSSILALLETAPPGAVAPDLAAQLSGYARKTLGLAGDFIQIARAASGALEFEVLNLADLITEATDDLWPIARRAGITLSVKGDDDEHLISGERNILTRAIINLIDNAVKYSPAGSTVTCTVATEGNEVVLAITDQGVGMPPEQLHTLAQPFQRLSTGKAADGIGLGLTLVWEVVRRHDATIAVTSRVGEGSTFTLRFPRTEDEA